MKLDTPDLTLVAPVGRLKPWLRFRAADARSAQGVSKLPRYAYSVLAGTLVAAWAFSAGFAGAQTVTPARPQANAQGTVPLYQVTVVGHTVPAVNFHVLGGATTLDLRGTTLLPYATGQATVQVERGATHIHVSVDKVNPAQRFGPEYLTYVMWAITPDGRATNLGEVQLLGQSAKMDVTTTLQQFGLLVTAEPYFAVTRPSDLVVMEGAIRPDTVGASALVEAKAELLQRGAYRLKTSAGEVTELPQSPTVPLDLYEAQNAVRIAGWAGAAQYAPDVLSRARQQLQQAEDYQARQAGNKPVATVARQAVESAEDARLLSLKRDAQARRAAATAATRAQAASAEIAAQAAAQQTAAAQDAAQQAAAERDAAEQQADEARRAAAAAQAQARAARARLEQQLNAVMSTRDTARGLILSMPDVLFALNRAELSPDAQVKLARVAGILEAYPGLTVGIHGYTDSTGTVAYNLDLSDKRAEAVENFLASQGVPASSMQAAGHGPDNPVASNASAAGRQQNRRVELVVNGAAIGSSSLPE